MSVPLPFYRGIDAIINKFDARSRWLLTESRYLFFYRFSFFILSGLQYTKSGFHEVGMERGLGHQTLPAQKCHQNISDMIHVDIRAGDRGEHPELFSGPTAPGAHREGNFVF